MNFARKIALHAVAVAMCVVTMSVSAVAGKRVETSALEFIDAVAAGRKTESVAANKQRLFTVLSAKAAAVFNTATAVTLTDFPITPTSNAVVELERSRPLVDGTTVFSKNGQPADEAFVPPVVQTFRGKIRGQEHSKVILTMINGTLTGAVEGEDGERYVISPLEDEQTTARAHALFAESGVSIDPKEMGFSCYTSDEHADIHDGHDSKHVVQERTLSNDLLEFNIAIETDYTLYTRFGRNLDRMRTYVLSLIAMVSSIYEDEINVTFTVSYFGHWETADPYQADGDISEMLSKFGQYWRSNKGGVSRTIAHLITGPGSTNVGGIAQLDELCNKSRGYSVSGIHASYTYPTTSYSWDVNVIAHELGHNFGSPHTHVCWFWGNEPLDTCVSSNPSFSAYAGDACYDGTPVRSNGSIMSYCHLLNGKVNLTFTDPVIQVIRSGAESATCMDIPANPLIAIQNPLGNQEFAVGENIEIRWTSARVSMVGIEYSADNGNTWNTIESEIPAATRKYIWKAPSVASSEMLVRVYDITNASVNDASTVVFKLLAPAISLSRPVGSERYAQAIEVVVAWDKVLVESVAIDFSADNGVTWETQATGITAREYKWRVPTVETAQAIVRVRDESNDAIISQSKPFTIGVPSISVTAPVAGDRWVAGTQQTIRWESDFVDKVRIEYWTANTGWSRVILLTAATTGTYTWTVPNNASENVVVRVTAALMSNGPADTSGAFIIAGTVGVGELSLVNETVAVVPQPADDVVTVLYTLLAATSNVRITIQDIAGRTVAEAVLGSQEAGQYRLAMPTATLAQGVYFVTVNTGNTAITRGLTIRH